MPTPLLSEQQREQFHRDGLLILPGFYDAHADIEPVQRAIHAAIGQVMQRHGVPDERPPLDPAHFDAGYQDLIRRDRSWGAEVYDAVKQLPPFVRLVAHPAHERLMRELRPGSEPGIAGGGYGIRIDNPGEERFRAQWHQEYPAQLRSLDGLVFWSPLVPVDEALGPVRFCPGSQREGPLPVYRGSGDGRSGAYALMLANQEALLSRYAQVAPLCAPTDLVIIDFLVLHASGYNRSQRSRWSMQFRYFNFADATGRSHGWKGSFAAGQDFSLIHPELCVDAP
ncbi:phytanoyl-CoA dioxygenase family protein [Roseateles sp.]|uniref:phytanoyl-CoA dioxygenase family protein n=1 Tax=Roseateles sp. TaxID=1971397 RepID=UPI0025E974A4|nr:phytanoyl-CoA dioxygenase family protein [Roseateles sp.]MBV8035002.1 phytanoyl-CoA dioxygenase family protein [Roseateles sp.]